MGVNWEHRQTRIDRVVHTMAYAGMVRRHRLAQGTPQTYGAALQHRTAKVLRSLGDRPTTLRVVSHDRLDPLDPEHGTWRIAFEGTGSFTVAPGDMLYLMPRNSTQEVDALLEQIQADGAQAITILTAGSAYRPASYVSLSLREALRQHVNIGEASSKMLKRSGLAHMVRHNAREIAAHKRYHRRAKSDEAHPQYRPYRVYLPSLINELGQRRQVDARALVALQDRLHPRPYTMTGFTPLDANRFRAEITVSQVDKITHEPDGSTVVRPGFASSFLAALDPGAELAGWILPELHHFPSTLGRTVPTIVVCTGSGISSLLSLLRTGHRGAPIWLIYGVRSWKRKHLYGPELESYREDGAIERLDVAVSRPEAYEGPARRVQDLIWDERQNLAAWLRRGAEIYVCGRLSMGDGVRATLRHIFVDQGLCSNQEQAVATLAEWEQTLRFQASVSGV